MLSVSPNPLPLSPQNQPSLMPVATAAARSKHLRELRTKTCGGCLSQCGHHCNRSQSPAGKSCKVQLARAVSKHAAFVEKDTNFTLGARATGGMLWLVEAALEDPSGYAPASFLTLFTLHRHSPGHSPLLFNSHKRFYKALWMALNHLYSYHRFQLNLSLLKLALCCHASECWHMACPLRGVLHRPLSHCGEPGPTGLILSQPILSPPLVPMLFPCPHGLCLPRSWGGMQQNYCHRVGRDPRAPSPPTPFPRSVILIFRMHQTSREAHHQSF